MFDENKVKTLYKECFRIAVEELIGDCSFRNSDFQYYVNDNFECFYDGEITEEIQKILDDYYYQLVDTFVDFIARF